MNKVFVSGGSGYIALHTIILLLQKNYFVVTSVKDKDKIAYKDMNKDKDNASRASRAESTMTHSNNDSQ